MPPRMSQPGKNARVGCAIKGNAFKRKQRMEVNKLTLESHLECSCFAGVQRTNTTKQASPKVAHTSCKQAKHTSQHATTHKKTHARQVYKVLHRPDQRLHRFINEQP